VERQAGILLVRQGQQESEPAAILLDDLEATDLPLVGSEAERTAVLTHVEALFQGLGGLPARFRSRRH
jgi:hypothetical protein